MEKYPLLDWNNQPIQEKFKPGPNINPMIDKHGTDPDGRKCSSCAYLVEIYGARNPFACKLRTGKLAGKHLGGWPACSQFEQRTGTREVYDGRK